MIVICNLLFLLIFRKYLPVMMDCYLMARMYVCIMYYSVSLYDITIDNIKYMEDNDTI